MKTLILNGSPHKNGDTSHLVNILKENLNGDFIQIHSYYDNIKPCIDCRYCWNNIGCKIDDEMQNIYGLLNTVDNVVIASPIYFSLLTGSLLSTLSRLQCFYAAKHIQSNASFALKKKNGILLLAGGGDGSYDPAINTAKILFHQMNCKYIGCAISHNTNKIKAENDTNVISDIINIANYIMK